jgi:hypothetical protein
MEHALLFAVHEVVDRTRHLFCATRRLLGKRRRIRNISSARFSAACLSSAGKRQRLTFEFVDSTGKQHAVYGYGGQSFEYSSQLGRERRDGWQLVLGIDLEQRALHRTGRST